MDINISLCSILLKVNGKSSYFRGGQPVDVTFIVCKQIIGYERLGFKISKKLYVIFILFI